MSQRNPLIMANLIRNWCDREPNLEILTFVEIDAGGEFQDETRSYQQLWDNGQRLAAWLRDQGMQKGDAFALVMQNHAEFVDFMVASSILGTVFVPIDSRTRGEKLKYMLNFAECRGAVVGDNALDEVESVWQGGHKKWIATLGEGQGAYPGISPVLAGPFTGTGAGNSEHRSGSAHAATVYLRHHRRPQGHYVHPRPLRCGCHTAWSSGPGPK